MRRFLAAVLERNSTGDSKEIREAIEGKARQRFEVSGVEGEQIKASVEAKISTGDFLGAIRAIYGLSEPTEGPNPPGSVPASLGDGRIQKKNT